MKWQRGRQNPYYSKLLIFKTKFMDCWLIRYCHAVGIGWHLDEVKGKDHYRLNIVLRNKNSEFWIRDDKGYPVQVTKRFILFRPDIKWHCVKVVGKDAYRLVLSIGWVRKAKTFQTVQDWMRLRSQQYRR